VVVNFDHLTFDAELVLDPLDHRVRVPFIGRDVVSQDTDNEVGRVARDAGRAFVATMLLPSGNSAPGASFMLDRDQTLLPSEGRP
jgi:hypothetical protein